MVAIQYRNCPTLYAYVGTRWRSCLRHCPTCFNPLNAELNLVCHLLTLLGANHILHISRIRVKGAGSLGIFHLHDGSGVD